jgi:GTP-binding protein
MMSRSLIAIVGRPNVGKSTLFNRIVGERKAVVSDIPGTTRDRVMAEAEWQDTEFYVVDTGGIEIQAPTIDQGRRPITMPPLSVDSVDFIPLIRAQAELAIQEADLILFVTDAISGLTGADMQVADLLRKSEKPVLLVANKVDNEQREQDAYEFYELGMGEVYTVSAIHGVGVGDLLDVVVEMLPPSEIITELDESVVRIAILGRPNVGKSSLLNKLLGEERAIVSPIPGTTRDSLDTEMMWGDRRVVLVDTAGIRRRGKVDEGVEKWSVLRSARALKRSDAALLLIDAVEGITAQDSHIAGLIADEGVSVVVVVNKWDAVDPEKRRNRQLMEDQIREDLKFLSYIPVLFISALTGYHVEEVIPVSIDIIEARYQRLPTGQLNDIVHQAMVQHAPPSKRGKRLRIYFATQPDVAPPHFTLYVNDPKLVHFSYQRYLENAIRDVFPFPGTPIRMTFRGH